MAKLRVLKLMDERINPTDVRREGQHLNANTGIDPEAPNATATSAVMKEFVPFDDLDT